MIFPSNRVRIMVATRPIDFRKGHDSLAAMVKNELRKDPFTGTVFVFRAKKADRLKLLYWVSHCRAIGPRTLARGARPGWSWPTSGWKNIRLHGLQ